METTEPPAPSDAVGDWPKGRNRIETAAHVHAFGMIALNASMLEELLLILLVAYLPMDREAATRLAGALNNRERADWLSGLVEKTKTDHDFADDLHHGILYCGICLDNRNMLIHSLYVGTDNVTANMRLTKRARNDVLRELRFEVSLTDLRKIADEIGNTVNYLLDLWFLKTQAGRLKEHMTWPDRPQQPDRLTIPQPQAVHAAGIRRPPP
jgi:hypothetical protein